MSDVRYEVAAVHDAHTNRRDARTFVDYLLQSMETFVSVTTVNGSERIDIEGRLQSGYQNMRLSEIQVKY